MISSGQLLGYAIASFLIIVVPGPGVLFVVGRALAHGRRTAIATAVGHAVGNYVVAACVAVGLGALLERSAQAFVAVKLAGALYLIWLGVQAFRHRQAPPVRLRTEEAIADSLRVVTCHAKERATSPPAPLPRLCPRGRAPRPAGLATQVA